MSSSTSNDVNYVNKHILCRLLRGWQLTGDVKHRRLDKSGIRGPCFTDNADLSALGCSFMPAAAAHPQAAPPTTGAPLQLDWRHCWRTGPGVARRSKADTRKPEKEVFLAGTERRVEGVATGLCLAPSNSICSIVLLLICPSFPFPSVLLKVVTHNLYIDQFGFILSLVTSLAMGKT